MAESIGASGVPGRIRSDWLKTIGALLVLNTLLVLPDRPSELGPWFFLRIAPEMPLTVLALALAPVWLRAPLRWAIVLFAAAIIFLSLADLMMRQALGRPFKPLLDFHLVSAGWQLFDRAVGWFGAMSIVTGLIVVLVAMVVGLLWSTRVLLTAIGGGSRRVLGTTAGIASIAVLGLGLSGVAPSKFDAASLLARHGERLARDIEVRRAFAVDVVTDPFAEMSSDELLFELHGRDVVLLFLESYGRSVIEDTRYRPVTEAALTEFDAALDRVGAGVRTGWLTSPVAGGQSWLAHGTFLAGLWLDGQRRYDTLLTTNRQTLIHAFDDAGWRTVAVMPAITQAWPQGSFFGYDRIYAAADLDYRGDPFNWVTMPDQYTLSAFHRMELAPDDRSPVMAEIALISSHAPWTPIAELVPWQQVGDGAIFNQWANSGDTPAVVWSDFDRVRSQYVLAMDYTLRTVAAYLEAYLDEDALVIVLGDHQPAPLITGEDASRDVPIHLISRDAELLANIDGWGWVDSVDPSGNAPVLRMDEFRDRFLAAFSPAALELAQAGE